MRLRRCCPILAAVLLGSLITAAGPGPANAAPAGAAAWPGQWHLEFLRVAAAHRMSTGTGIRIGVVDTGVADHPDLRRNLRQRIDLVAGRSGAPATEPADVDGHGTAMAGLIAAHGRPDGSGVLGLAPDAAVVSVRDRSLSGAASADGVAAGITAAVAAGVDVVNVSTATAPSPALARAVETAIAADVVVVAAAGNRPRDHGVAFPAFIDGVVAVGAIGRDGNHHPLSVTGPGIVLTAPGEHLRTTGSDGGYREVTGTSAAAALVSGAAALVRARFPELTAPQVVARLTATAVDRGQPGRDEQYGHGVLDLVAALSDGPPAPPHETPAAAAAVGAVAGGGAGPPRPDGFVLAGTAIAAALLVAVPVLVLRRRRGRR
ncbi:S8 family serine peptidase [Solwaraspora sp. WMMB335]|uniref:S8 family serine peptidase n=1 Tax=Solwaraspora sp. WMMB335 TaxID=3404118 RepID=UPI003B9464EC